MFLKFTIRIIGRSQKHSFRAIMGFALIISMVISTSGVISGFSTWIFGLAEKVGESPSIFIQARDPTEGIPSEIPTLINHTNIKRVLPISERMISISLDSGVSSLYFVGVNISELLNYYSNAEIYAGRVPQSNSTTFECLVGKDIQSIIHVSEINLTDISTDSIHELSVVGYIQNVKEFQRTIIVELTDYLKIFNQKSDSNIYQRIKIFLKNGKFVKETISALRTLLKDYQQILTIKPEQQADILAESLYFDIISQLNILFGVLLIIALLRIFHSISWFVRKYERDLLIMRSLGMSSFQMIFLIELLALLIGNTGLIIGIFFGILIPPLIFSILALFFSGGFLIPEFTLSTTISLILYSNLIVVLAALYPAVNITLKKPSTLSILVHGLYR